ncbi:alpha/beta fold hydrolase [Paenibacillus sp. N10]|uniref:Alpha/beta fold hydrolase n=2 Tax=Paenibacillus lutrae TaxID=2078573 RepID=A0A7X3FFA9_9BACL|nr:alpha/beta fold hydrolase [Paenibacillus lutrae]MVO98381.1 alpha/beta fold hydrolase [Paenibacillus lutrae]
MDEPEQGFEESRPTILWLTGWSMPNTAFEHIRQWLPEYRHTYADYTHAGTAEEILRLAETAAGSLRASRHIDPAKREPSGRLLIAGWSLGGLLALRLASQGQADGLILFGATAKFVRPKEERNLGWPDAYLKQMLGGLGKDRRAVESKFRQLVFGEPCGALACLAAGSWSTPALAAGLEILRREEYLAELQRIGCPVLLFHGTEDKVCPFAAAEELHRHLPRAKLVALSGAGHVPFAGRETYIAEVIRSWWR